MISHNAIRVKQKPRIWLIFGALISGGEELLWASKLDATRAAATKQAGKYRNKLKTAKFNKKQGTDLTQVK